MQNNDATATTGSPFPYSSFAQVGNSGWGISGWANAAVLESGTTGGLVFDTFGTNDGPILFQTNRVSKMALSPSGYFGVGTTAPSDRLNVAGTTNGNAGQIVMGDGSSYSPYIKSYRWTGTGLNYFQTTIGDDLTTTGALEFQTGVGGAAIGSDTQTTRMVILPVSGYVGIGTTAPTATLEVNGSVKVDNGLTFSGQTGTQTTPWTGVLCGGDYAEDMRADQKKESYEPGDVLVLTSDDNSDVQKSVEPYSAMVAGIYATKPGVVGLRDAVAKSKDNVPMAMVGVVPTKVSAENGPIHKGDLLVTSSLRGFAMKGTDRSRMLGAVIGKAMGSLDSGTGVIEVLVTLQ